MASLQIPLLVGISFLFLITNLHPSIHYKFEELHFSNCWCYKMSQLLIVRSSSYCQVQIPTVYSLH